MILSKNGVDDGFQLIYWKLSYRRKFIRTLWLIPIAIIVSIYIYVDGNDFYINRLLPCSIIILEALQLIYTHKKWKDNKKSSDLNK